MAAGWADSAQSTALPSSWRLMGYWEVECGGSFGRNLLGWHMLGTALSKRNGEMCAHTHMHKCKSRKHTCAENKINYICSSLRRY